MSNAIDETAKYCKAWIWALGVMVGGPLLFVAIVGKRGIVALLVRSQHHAAHSHPPTQ